MGRATGSMLWTILCKFSRYFEVPQGVRALGKGFGFGKGYGVPYNSCTPLQFNSTRPGGPLVKGLGFGKGYGAML